MAEDKASSLSKGQPALLLHSYEVAVVIASGAPSNFTITEFHISYHLVQQSFPSSQDKQVLRFTGASPASLTTTIKLPGNATIASANVKLEESLRRERSARLTGSNNVELPDRAKR
jgi:hypothetical protein